MSGAGRGAAAVVRGTAGRERSDSGRCVQCRPRRRHLPRHGGTASPGALPWEPANVAAPRRAALRVCAAVGGGLPHGFSEGWEGTHGLGVFLLGPQWLAVPPAAVMDSLIIQERLVERLLSPRTQAQRSHPAKLKVRACIYSGTRAGGARCPSGRPLCDGSPARSDGAEGRRRGGDGRGRRREGRGERSPWQGGRTAGDAVSVPLSRAAILSSEWRARLGSAGHERCACFAWPRSGCALQARFLRQTLVGEQLCWSLVRSSGPEEADVHGAVGAGNSSAFWQ